MAVTNIYHISNTKIKYLSFQKLLQHAATTSRFFNNSKLKKYIDLGADMNYRDVDWVGKIVEIT